MATTSASKAIAIEPIPTRELLDYRADVKGKLFRQIRKRFNFLKANHNLTQAMLAKRISVDPGLLCRRLRGDNDMQLETLSDLARGLDCRIDVRLTPLTDIVPVDLGGLPFKALTQTVITNATSGSSDGAAPVYGAISAKGAIGV